MGDLPEPEQRTTPNFLMKLGVVILEIKGLKRQNLRDHMNDLELIFSMLGEAATTEIARVDDARGFQESRKAARKGGEVSGTARKDLERKTGRRVVSPENYLGEPESRKRLKR
jgi:DNA-damage-inducible protein D